MTTWNTDKNIKPKTFKRVLLKCGNALTEGYYTGLTWKDKKHKPIENNVVWKYLERLSDR